MSKELNEANFKSEISDYAGAALVDFWAPWCGPCRVMGPIVDNLAKKYEGKIKIAKVNVDDNQGLAGQFNVMSIPSLVFFKGGKVVHTHLGATTEVDLENQLKQHFGL
ncbi:MAG TPA: thioredoxin [Candidatus Ozemobacteraceae bacterium]|nr:thioredoxin [Candidatus Ozemobacteraceae bacterium]HQG29340.1 thioredoxin [Candidatus Ozemobacteraceae bacterium]